MGAPLYLFFGRVADDIVCVVNQYRVGSSPGVCKTCSSAFCTSGSYRSGSCSGTDNGFTCNACPSIACGSDEFFTGSCYGTTNNVKCTAPFPPILAFQATFSDYEGFSVIR